MLASPSPSGGTTYPSSELYTGHRLVPNIVSVIMFGPICNYWLACFIYNH
jgi:hypothetical protein